MPKTKIVCTIGPASGDPETLRQLIVNGMNVARLNFSHGTHAEHQEKIDLIRTLSNELQSPVAILQDLCGPKIRVGAIPGPGIRLNPGQTFILTSDRCEPSQERVSVSYPGLPQEVLPGDRILLADGLMELVVRQTSRQDIVCDVLTGGVLTSHKGINLPTRTLRAQSLTEKDKADLEFGLANDVDFIGVSFVRSPEDVLGIKTLIRSANKQTPVIAKIEKHEALDHIDAIMGVSDGIMVARGDLGVEIPLEQVPGIQKMLVKKANNMGKPVIIATQMLRSMVNSPRPTRAEANDVANAVLDGADATMLSEETASGDYPVQSLQYMARIAETAEKGFAHEKYLQLMPQKEISEAVAYASCVLADHLNVKAIIAPTRSGFTAAQISRFKPQTQIIALSPDQSTVRRLCLYWGCVPYQTEDAKDTDDMFEKAAAGALQTRHLSAGDLVIITAGHPGFVAGSTEMVRVKNL